jgi:phospholipid/cholesterol/gamma-HCH transport system permease protein
MVSEAGEAMQAENGAAASFEIDESGDAPVFRASGDWSVRNIAHLDNELREFSAAHEKGRAVVFDLSDVTRLDTAGAWVFRRMAHQAGDARIEGITETFQLLLQKVGDHIEREEPKPPKGTAYQRFAGRIGAFVGKEMHEFIELLDFFGSVMRAIAGSIVIPTRLRIVPLVHHMEKAGFDALPLVCLLTFLIGGVIAQQGAAQLERFGAEIFTVNLVAIIFLREVGILLTAIIVAGRSGSAFAAEIGSMKMHQEIDAMRTLGLDPTDMLIVPRVLALVIMLPMLTFVADIMGLLGGGIAAWITLDISPGVYIERVRQASDFWTFGVGLIKAPFMALVIALVGCRCGMMVEGSAESVGQQTTQAVVRSIFLVIIIDALFAIFFTSIGV